MSDLKLLITHYKILDTIKYLNEKKLYPTPIGIFKILIGKIDDDTNLLQDCPTFSRLTSYNSKKISILCVGLSRHGYIKKIFDSKTEELYLSITEKGNYALQEFHKRYKHSYPISKSNFVPQIVKID